MCGIYGFIGKPTNKTKKIMYRLGVANEARGKDSAGVSIIYPNGKYYLLKGAMTSRDLFAGYSPFTRLIPGHPQVVIGHTRAATTGAINNDNAHPFIDKNIIYAHNGMIYNFDRLQHELGTAYTVDTQIIGHYLASEGLTGIMQNVSGSFALPYVDISTPTRLNLIRYNNPLHIAMRRDKMGLYFASQEDHLHTALKSANLADIPIYSAKELRQYSFEFTDRVYSKKTDYSIKNKRRSAFVYQRQNYPGIYGGYKLVDGKWIYEDYMHPVYYN